MQFTTVYLIRVCRIIYLTVAFFSLQFYSISYILPLGILSVERMKKMKNTIIKFISDISKYITAKRISVAVCIVLYITTFFTTTPFFPENSESVLSISVSVAFIISFYIMTAIVSPSRRCLIGFSVYFALVTVVLLQILSDIYIDFILWRLFSLAVFTLFMQPTAQFCEFIDRRIIFAIYGKRNDYTYDILWFVFIALFYIVYFTSWYFKHRKDEK